MHDHRVRAGVVDDLRGALPDRGLGQALEVAQGRRVTEHDPTQRGPVERAVAADDTGAEPVDDGGERRGAGFDDLARHGIGVDDDARPSDASWADTVDLPEPIPPVRPTRSMSATLARGRGAQASGRRDAPGSRRWRPVPSGSG